jgi:tetratricopeptide (TPR) repeat protein
MNQGDEYLGEGKVEEALGEYQAAAGLAPDIEELPFWHAVTLVDQGRLEEALPIFEQVFTVDSAWAVLLERLPAVGLLREDEEMMKQILALVPSGPVADR